MRILYTDLASTGTLTANSEATGYPKENVYHPFKTKVWRSTGITSEWLKWDLGSATNANVIAIINHNFQGGGTYKFQGNATDAWGAPSVDETLTYNSGIIVKYITGGSYRWWRLLMTNTSGTYISVGRVMFGAYWQPDKTFRDDWQDGKADVTSITKSIEGQVYSDIRDQYEVFNLNVGWGNSTDKTNLKSAMTTLGIGKNALLTLDQNNPSTTTYYVRSAEMPRITNHVHSKISYALSFEEAL